MFPTYLLENTQFLPLSKLKERFLTFINICHYQYLLQLVAILFIVIINKNESIKFHPNAMLLLLKQGDCIIQPPRLGSSTLSYPNRIA